MAEISRRPVVPPADDPSAARYWDPRDLETELRRTFQVCHECRMCIGFCGAFPAMFAAVDRDIEAGRTEGAEAVGLDDFRRAGDACWQCKLCYLRCPYTADEGASELLDVPRVFARERAQRARRDGIPIVDRVLGEPHLVGALGSGPAAPAGNSIAAHRLARRAAERATGISADFPLPPMAREPFGAWMRRHDPAPGAGDAGTVVLFATCYGTWNFPSVPRAAVRVIERAGYRVLWPDQTCCGMPNLDGGDVEAMRRKVRSNVASLLPHVRAGAKVVTPGPTCGYTIRKEWARYVDAPDVREVADATMDLMQMAEGLRRAGRLPLEGARGLGVVAYHAACHLRAQKIGLPGARLLASLPGTEVRVVEACSAVDGTWGMKAANYETGRRYARRLVDGVREAGASIVVSDCQLAGQRVLGETGARPLHPVEALARALGLDDEGAKR